MATLLLSGWVAVIEILLESVGVVYCGGGAGFPEFVAGAVVEEEGVEEDLGGDCKASASFFWAFSLASWRVSVGLLWNQKVRLVASRNVTIPARMTSAERAKIMIDFLDINCVFVFKVT